MNTRKHLVAAFITGALALGSVGALAQPSPGGYGPGYGPGMMHGYGGDYGPMHGYGGWGMGPGMMYGYGPGYGMGPGMMYGYGMGPGMMYGYGPGGWGMGPGMMYGYGGYPPGYGPNLSDEQRQQIAKIQQDLQRKQWDLMSKMRDAYAAGYNAQDDKTAKQTYKNIAELREQMFDNMLAARKQIDGVLAQAQGNQGQGK